MNKNEQGETEQIKILGVNIDCIDKDGLLNRVCDWVKGNKVHVITYVNAHCLNLAHFIPRYREILNCADLVYSDGISVVWASRFLYRCVLHKITGREWIFDFCKRALDYNISIYILASAPGIAQRAAFQLKSQFPGLNIVGTSDGYFSEKSEGQVINEILQAKPEVLFVGMGTPRQEFWIFDHLKDIQVPVCWAVGALFDYVAGAEPSVPKWMDDLALEWLWRLIIDPIGKWKRYILGNPYFLLRVLAQKVNGFHSEE